MKNKGRILFILLISVLTLLCFSSCSDKDIPEDYQLVVRTGDTFRLYVPTQGWMPNTGSGVTSAYYSVSTAETGNPAASVSVYIPDDATECESVAEYWEICKNKLSNELDDFNHLSENDENTSLGGESAKKYIYTAKMYTGVENSDADIVVTYKFMQVMAMHNGKIYVLVMSAPESQFEARAEEMNGSYEDDDLGIIGYFKFADAYVSDDDKKYSTKTDIPDGMVLASSKERPYTLFAPMGWTVDESSDITTVYASDKSNLTVQYIMPSEAEHSADKYLDACLDRYKSMLSDFVSEEATETTIGGVDGSLICEFSGSSGGVKYKFKQAVVLKGEVYYVITYTALSENYDTHISDVDKMIECFSLK